LAKNYQCKLYTVSITEPLLNWQDRQYTPNAQFHANFQHDGCMLLPTQGEKPPKKDAEQSRF